MAPRQNSKTVVSKSDFARIKNDFTSAKRSPHRRGGASFLFRWSRRAQRTNSRAFDVAAAGNVQVGNDAGDTHAIENPVAAQIAAANAGSPITREEAIEQIQFIDKSERFNFEGQFNFDVSGFHLISGFNAFDLNLSYQLQSGLQFNLSVTNLFDTEMREMVASPAIQRLAVAEVKYTL